MIANHYQADIIDALFPHIERKLRDPDWRVRAPLAGPAPPPTRGRPPGADAPAAVSPRGTCQGTCEATAAALAHGWCRRPRG